MQPRGQLWFELQRVCKDFRDFSGLSEKEAVQVVVIVLGNLLAEQQGELDKLKSLASDAPTGGHAPAL